MVKKIKPKQESETDEKDAARDITAPDEFISTTAKGFHWLQDNSSKVVAVIAVVFGLAIVLGGISWYQHRGNSAASLDLHNALRLYHRPVSATPAPEGTSEDELPFPAAKEKYTAAKEALKSVVDKHGNTGPGGIALLYLADSEAHLGEYDAAIGHYQAFLKRVSGTDPLRFLALQGLGVAQEAKGDLKAAADTMQDLSKVEGKLGRDYGLFHGGRILIAQGNKDEGKKLLEKLTKEKDYEASPLKTRAEELLSTLQ